MAARACDACKMRKVKCDGAASTAPCSNCRMSGLPCQYLQLAKKRGRKPHPGKRRTRSRSLSQHTSTGGEQSWDRGSIDMFVSPPADNPVAFDSHSTLDQGHPTPAWTAATPQSMIIQNRDNINASIQALHQELVRSLASGVPNWSLDKIVATCIDFYMQNLFPIAPLVHEPSLRSNMTLYPPCTREGSSTGLLATGELDKRFSSVEDVAKLRSYTLTTALCATAAFMLPAEILLSAAIVGASFHRVSREMLKLYQDVDLMHPDSSSVVIRLFHAGTLHTEGRTRVAWQAFEEALHVAEQMRLYDESSFNGLDRVEAQIRRFAFWQLYALDKYSTLLDSRPMTSPGFSLDGHVTTAVGGDSNARLMDTTARNESPEIEEQLLTGYYLIIRLWSAAFDVELDLQTLSRWCRQAGHAQMRVEAEKIDLMGTYLRFVGVLDTMPPSLESLERIRLGDGEAMVYQRRSLWVQRTNFLVSYHCLRMALLQRFAHFGLTSLLGFNDEGMILALRKTEIAQDFISVITSVPFDSLHAHGEACVTKIRRVGATLLEVMQQVNAPQIVSRAKSLLPRLLDVLARLDSRASDELNSEYIH